MADRSPRVITPQDLELSELDITLLQHVYKTFAEVYIEKELGGGYSGARVFLTLPVREDGSRVARQVAKLGSASELRREWNSYRQYVGPALPYWAAQMGEFCEEEEQAALSYIFMGGALGETPELKSYYRSVFPLSDGIARVKRVLDDLLDKALGSIWYAETWPLNRPFATQYSQYMVEHLRLRLRPESSDALWSITKPPVGATSYEQLKTEDIPRKHEKIQPSTLLSIEELVVTQIKSGEVTLQDPGGRGIIVGVQYASENKAAQGLDLGSHVGVRGEVVYNRRDRMKDIVQIIFPDLVRVSGGEFVKLTNKAGPYPNPLQIYPKVLDKTLESRKSLVHGDLHPSNVLVNERQVDTHVEIRSWLIDFAKVEKRHNIFDFIRLETYVRTWELAPDNGAFSLDDYVQFEEALNSATLGVSVTPPGNPHLRFAYDVILTIRNIARKYMGPTPDFGTEYFPALFLYCLAVTKYYSNDGIQGARLAFTTATILAHYLPGIGNNDTVNLGKSIPSAGSDEVQQRRIDAAVPSQTTIGDHIDVRVQVRFPDSPLLGIEDWPGRHKPASVEQASEPVALNFPYDSQSGRIGPARLSIEVTALGFDFTSATTEILDVPLHEFSKCLVFHLIAKKIGKAQIYVRVHGVDGTYLGDIPVETTVEIATADVAQSPSVASLVLIVIVGSKVDETSIPSPTPLMNSRWLLVSGTLGFIAGVMGNLIAAWIQQDILNNTFTPLRVAGILLLTAMSLGLQVLILRWHPSYGRWLLVLSVAFVGVATLLLSIGSSSGDVFEYQVRVESNATHENLSNAKVTVEVGGQAPLDSLTDANGLARIFILAEYAGRPAVLLVQATGFIEHRQNVDLVKGALPKVVQLELAR